MLPDRPADLVGGFVRLAQWDDGHAAKPAASALDQIRRFAVHETCNLDADDMLMIGDGPRRRRNQLQVDPATVQIFEPPIEVPHQPIHFAVAAGCVAAVGANLIGHAIAGPCCRLTDEILGGGVGMNVDDHVVPCEGSRSRQIRRLRSSVNANERGRY